MLSAKEQTRVDKRRWKKQAREYRKAKRKFLKENPDVLKGRFLRDGIVQVRQWKPFKKLRRNTVGDTVYVVMGNGQWVKTEEKA